jgi:nitroreductase
MEFYDVVKNRRSIRGYKSDAVPSEALERIGEAVRMAPSACNMQPWNFRIVLNDEMRQKICQCYSADWLKEAPAIVVVLGNAESCWKRLEGDPIVSMDIGIVMEHFVLAAAAEGLGSCWICAYDVEKMNKMLGVMKPWSVYAISPLGYANAEPREFSRKPIDELFKVIN